MFAIEWGSLGERCTKIIILLWNKIQANQFNFIPMRRNQGFKIKTINLDPDIFIQETNNNHKLTVPLIRTLTQRKDRLKTKNMGQNLQKAAKSYRQRHGGLEDVERNSLNLRGESQQHQEIADNSQSLKEHLKTNPNISLPVTSRRRINKFERYNHIHSFATPGKAQDPEMANDPLMKEYYWQQLTQEREGERKESCTDLNPYTKDQQMDQKTLVQRSVKINRMSSITKSYRIATISLTPQNSRRRASLHTGTTTPQIQKNLIKPASRKQRGEIRQSQIKPWEAPAFQSREYLS